ncbi:MAG: right-handed parallel beta-helix repeat-containing protein [Phycisphaerales bacterium]
MQKNSTVSMMCVCATVLVCVAMVSNAGPLDPPAGPVASTYKTLDEVEARRPINDVFAPGNANSLHVISQSGSYYLTGPLTVSGLDNAIEVLAPNVTIDLNGYTIAGSSLFGSPLRGILLVNTAQDAVLTVRNGTITGFTSVGLRSTRVDQSVILRDLVFTANDVGAIVPGDVDAASCAFLRNTGAGLSGGRGSIVRDCRALDNGFAGIAIQTGRVEGCVAEGNAYDGIVVGVNDDGLSIARNNVANMNSGHGISGLNAIVEGNAVGNNLAGGVRTQTQVSFSLLAAGVIENNFLKLNGDSPGEIGIFISGEHYRVDRNTISGSPVGILSNGFTDNVFSRNTVDNATTPYSIPAGNVAALEDSTYSTDRAWQNIRQ